jgi:hypothetical protein
MNAGEVKDLPEEPDADIAEPDVDSDRRVPRQDPSPDESPPKPRRPPLDIKQIEEIEDDAPGG